MHYQTIDVTPTSCCSGKCTASVAKISRWPRLSQILGVILILYFCSIANASSRSSQPPQALLVSIPWRGHVNPLRAIAHELVEHGFQVRFALPAGYKHLIDEEFECIPIGQVSHIKRVKETPPNGGIFDRGDGVLSLTQTLVSFQNAMFPELLAFVDQERPGVMVIDRFTLAGLSVAQALNVTYVVNNPHLLLNMDHPPWHLPAPFGYSTSIPTSLWDRMLNVINAMRFHLDVLEAFDKLEQSEPVDNMIPSLNVIDHSLDIVLTDTVFGLEYPRDLPPRLQMIGPLIPPSGDPSKLPLPESLQTWLDDAVKLGKQVILIQLGSSLDYLSQDQVATLLDGLLMINDVRFLWIASPSGAVPESSASVDDRIRDENVINQRRIRALFPRILPGSMRLYEEFIDQWTVLQHDAVSVLITHGSLTSVQEAILNTKPVVVLPIFGDHWDVALRITNSGLGRALEITDPNKFAALEVATTVSSLMGDHMFKEQAAKLNDIYKFAGGVEQAVTTIDLCYRIGTEYLLTYEHRLPWYQSYYLLDVFIVFGTVLGAIGLLIRQCWSGLNTLVGVGPQ